MALLRRALALFREGSDWLCSAIEDALSRDAYVSTCDNCGEAIGTGRTRHSKCEDNRRKSSGPPLISTFVRRRAE
jgi:hypothetical protein